MTVIQLPSIDDPRLDPYRDLPKTNLARVSGRFVVEGRLLVERLLASEYEVDSILVDRGRRDLLPAGIAAETPVYVTPDGAVEQLVGFDFHRGILACGRRRPATGLVEALGAGGERLVIVVCVEVRDPTNLGGILRSAAAFGVDAVVISPRCADPFSRRVLRVSMGAVLRLPIVSSSDLVADLQTLRRTYQLELLATVLADDAEPLDQVERPARLGLLIGSEGHGLPAAIVAECSRRVTIPIRPDTDSLNAAVASGVFLFHFCRDRRA